MTHPLAQRSAWAFGVAMTLWLAAPATAAEAVYKWTDAEGVTHFSAMPPAGREAELLTVEPPPPTAAQPAADGQQEAGDDGRPQDPAEGLAEPSAEELAKQEEQRKRNCETAKRNLETLETRVHVRIRDEKTGEDRYLTPEEHTQWKKDSALRIDEYCKPPGGA
ncbi:MAG: DUF4124 domain-containing protein [Pseudomonadota bacterium]|jgi:hypothetical protein